MLSPGLRAISTVFLDRDGTLNVNPSEGDYIVSPADLVLLPGVAGAIAALNAARVRTVLVTNQRWLSRPGVQVMTYAAIHARLERLLAAEGAWLDAAYHCPHAIGACDCRKPAPGMLQRASAEHGFDLSSSVIVGDSDTDVMAGRSAGAQTIRLHQPQDGAVGVQADASVCDLPTAVRLILQSYSSAEQRTLAPVSLARCVRTYCQIVVVKDEMLYSKLRRQTRYRG